MTAPGTGGPAVPEEKGAALRRLTAMHNPWSMYCGKRVDGEPYRAGERCPTCEPAAESSAAAGSVPEDGGEALRREVEAAARRMAVAADDDVFTRTVDENWSTSDDEDVAYYRRLARAALHATPVGGRSQDDRERRTHEVAVVFDEEHETTP